MKKYLSIALLTGSLLLSGCGNSDNFVFTNTNTNVQVAPICVDDAYTTNQNQVLTVNAANGVLANDQPNGGTLSFSPTSTQGGTVASNADGSFQYTPATNFNGADSFTYSVTNSAGQVTCTVNITVISTNGFFVDAANGNDGTGSFTNGMPFQTIQAAVAAAPTNADIVVLPGSYTGTVNLKDGQRLLGSGSVLAQGATRPQLTGPVVLADGNTLDFLRIEGTNGDAVDAEGQNGGTMTNCELANTMAGVNGGDGIDCRDTRGTWTVSNNEFINLNGTAFGCTTTGTNTATYVYSNNVATSNGLSGWVSISRGNSVVRVSVVGNVFRNNNQIAGSGFEAVVEDAAELCLNLESNVNDADSNENNTDDGVYRFSNSDTGSDFSIEELVLNPNPDVPGNTGSFSVDTGLGFADPTPVVDGFCGF